MFNNFLNNGENTESTKYCYFPKKKEEKTKVNKNTLSYTLH